MKQRKIMEINEGRWHLVCIKAEGVNNPYRLYRVWWDGGNHRKLLAKYADIESIMCWLYDHMVRGMEY